MTCWYCACVHVLQACSVVPDFWRPQGLWPVRLLCPWDPPGKNTGVGCHFLLQGIFLTQGVNLCLLLFRYWHADSLPLSHLGSPSDDIRCLYMLYYCVLHQKKVNNICFLNVKLTKHCVSFCEWWNVDGGYLPCGRDSSECWFYAVSYPRVLMLVENCYLHQVSAKSSMALLCWVQIPGCRLVTLCTWSSYSTLLSSCGFFTCKTGVKWCLTQHIVRI